jgi:hypothetical protein
MLEQSPLNKGAAGGGKKETSRGTLVELRDTTPTLAELGITKRLSSRAQLLASRPEKDAAGSRPRARRRSSERTLVTVFGLLYHLSRSKPNDRGSSPASNSSVNSFSVKSSAFMSSRQHHTARLEIAQKVLLKECNRGCNSWSIGGLDTGQRRGKRRISGSIFEKIPNFILL